MTTLITRKTSSGKDMTISLDDKNNVTVTIDGAVALTTSYKNIDSATVKGQPQITHILGGKLGLLKGECALIVNAVDKNNAEKRMENKEYAALQAEYSAEKAKVASYNRINNEGKDGFNPHSQRCAEILSLLAKF